jgi:hypothetical protein
MASLCTFNIFHSPLDVIVAPSHVRAAMFDLQRLLRTRPDDAAIFSRAMKFSLMAAEKIQLKCFSAAS